LDFEWAHSGPVDYPDDCGYHRITQLMWSTYTLSACMRWGKTPEEIRQCQLENVDKIKELLPVLRTLVN